MQKIRSYIIYAAKYVAYLGKLAWYEGRKLAQRAPGGIPGATIIIVLILLAVIFGKSIVTFLTTPKPPPFMSAPTSSGYLYQATNPYSSVTAYVGEQKTNAPKVENKFKNGETVNFELDGVNTNISKPVINNIYSVSFSNVKNNIDINYQTLANGLKESVIVKGPQNSDIYTFTINTKGATPKQIGTNLFSNAFFDNKGNYLFSFAKPYAVDAKGDRSDNVVLSIIQDPGSENVYKAKLTLNRKWISDPKRAYPITIDPTVIYSTSSLFANGTFNRIQDTGSGGPSPNLTLTANKYWGVYTSDVIDFNSVVNAWNPLIWTELGVTTGSGQTPFDSTSLIAQWNFDSTSGTSATADAGSCGSSCNGTLTNFQNTTAQDVAPQSSATGGTVTYTGTDEIHTFTATGTFTVTGGAVTAQVLAVGGGGGGGFVIAGGGGGGGVVYNSSFTINPGVYTVTVGTGGGGATSTCNLAGYGTGGGTQGNNSVFSTITAVGGGGGGNFGTTSNGATTGGSGGGIGGNNATTPGMAGTAGQGYAGGTTGANQNDGAGGGGASQAGGNATSGTAGKGGDGVANSISGASVTYGGGGGGGARNPNGTGYGAGGAGGGGHGGYGTTAGVIKGVDGTANLGGGGGGAGYYNTGPVCAAGGNGGDGVVIIRFPASGVSGWTANNARWGTGALMFNGLTNTIDVGNPASLGFDRSNAFSIATWFKSSTAPSTEYDLFSKMANSAPYTGYNFWVNSSGYPAFYLINTWSTNTIFKYATTNVIDGQWHYLVVTYDGSSNASGVNLYVDGKLSAATVGFNSLSASITNSTDVFIGSRGGTAFYTNGSLDALSVYGRALTASEILSDYNAGNIDFQTRVGTTTDPNDGSWEAWRPTTSESSLLALNSDSANWHLDDSNAAISISDDSVLTTDGSGGLHIDAGELPNDNNTVALWHLNDTFGVGAYLLDSSGNGNAATPNGTTLVDGVVGKARSFNGTSDYISLPVANGTVLDIDSNPVTIEAWIKLTAVTGTNQWILGRGTQGVDGYGLYIAATNGDVRVGGHAGSNIGNNTAISTGVWHHVAGVINGANSAVYVDGVKTATGTVNVVASSGGMNIGVANNGSYLYWFGGSIDEVRISNIARSDAQIAEDYLQGRGARVYRDISSTDLSSAQGLTFNLASDEYTAPFQIIVGGDAYSNYDSDANTVGLWRFEDPPSGFSATGGTVTYVGGYEIHSFSTSGTFTTNNVGGSVDYLLVGGGGSGGFAANADGNASGGGGGGGVVYNTGTSLVANTGYPVVVGTGGTSTTSTRAAGLSSTFVGVTALGGGYGGVSGGAGGGTNGTTGSGGGAGNSSTTLLAGGGGTTGQGNNGGSSQNSGTGTSGSAAGGGGAGVAGQNVTSNAGGGNGGDGVANSITGTSVYYGGGGGGSDGDAGQGGSGGNGGGGAGGSNVAAGTNGTDGRGGGGGGAVSDGTAAKKGGDGGNGVVIVRLPQTDTGSTTVSGRIGSARSFNGTSAFIYEGNPAAYQITGALTIDAWIQTTADPSSGFHSIVVKLGTGAGQYGYWLREDANGFANFGVSSDGTTSSAVFGTTALNDGRWHHIAGVYVPSTSLSIYVDGQLQGVNTTSIPASIYNSPGAVTIGGSQTGVALFNGYIDEVRISNVARTAAQIRASFDFPTRRLYATTSDFEAQLTGSVTSGTTSFNLDATVYGLSQKGSGLYPGDKLIIRSFTSAAQYTAQATVKSVNASTGDVVIEGWDAGSSFPGGGFGSYATVFKWQREYYNLSNYPASERTGVTRISIRIPATSSGMNYWVDDIRTENGYLTNPAGSTITSSTGNEYMQYRAILTTSTNTVAPSLTGTTVDFQTLAPNNAPTTLTALSTTSSSITWQFNDTATDETGWKVYDTNKNLTATCATTNGAGVGTVTCTETGLLPNTSYTRKVVAYNANGNSFFSNSATAVTLANIPLALYTGDATASSINIQATSSATPVNNPTTTEMAIYQEPGVTCDGTGGFYLKADGTSNGSTPVWQTAAAWGEVAITGLDFNANQYIFCVKAHNNASASPTDTAFSGNSTGGGYMPLNGNFTMKGDMTFGANVKFVDGNNAARYVVGLDHNPGNNSNDSNFILSNGTLTVPQNTSVVAGSFTFPNGSQASIALPSDKSGQLVPAQPMWMKANDNDNDGYFKSGADFTKAYYGNQPSGGYRRGTLHKLVSTGTDCNDGDAQVFISHAQCYHDNDKDTWTTGLQPNSTCINTSSCATATKASDSTDGASVSTFAAGQLRNSASASNDCDDNVAVPAGHTNVFGKICVPSGGGSGDDGAITYNSGATVNYSTNGDGPQYAVTAFGPSTLAASSPTGISAGDEIMLINVQGSTTAFGNVGNYENFYVTNVSGNTITVYGQITKIYGATTDNSTLTGQNIVVQRIPNFTNVTVSAGTTLTSNAFNGTSGGIIGLRASGTLTVTGSGSSIDESGIGFRKGTSTSQGGEAFCGYGGGGNNGSNGTHNYCGGGGACTSNCTAGTGSSAAGGSGGVGSGGCNSLPSGAGGSGGYGTVGTGNGTASLNVSSNGQASGTCNGGEGGAGGSYGVATLSDLFMGSGGAQGGGGAAAGAGGGIVFLGVNTLSVVSSGTIWSKGGQATGNGGAGAGGSIFIDGTTVGIGTGLVSAAGGTGGGNNGGAGRIAISGSVTGTSTPAFHQN